MVGFPVQANHPIARQAQKQGAEVEDDDDLAGVHSNQNCTHNRSPILDFGLAVVTQ